MKRRLTQKTLEQVKREIGGFGLMNSPTARYYNFTLDYYNGKKSWTGEYDYEIKDDYEHAIELLTGKLVK